ncbi:hypothetical protein [Bacteroides heparinolyticus]|uniref:hypothetical protein n=4 Tax=Prevotella heparinolytica TaxID=28113 RepID=UPI0035A13CA8
MKTYRIVFIFFFLLGSVESFSQDVYHWDTRIEQYNGDEYIIKSGDYVYSIINKKYDLVKEATLDIEFDGESEKEFKQRRAGLRARILEIADSVFEFRNTPLEEPAGLIMQVYFDSRTKDYVGIEFVVDIELKDYITLPKVQLLEKKMLEARLNAGKSNLLNPRKYFIIDSGKMIGGKWRYR